MADIKTRWYEQARCECPLPEHPRPQFMREAWCSLNGEWDYAVSGREDKAFPGSQGKILVPFAIESALSGVEKGITASDRLWYKKAFEIPAGFAGKRILLHFDAVDWQCKVFINGKKAGDHTGGY